ncbi:MAG: ferritin family protein [Candidatus Saccharibacteria bacterium]|nr:ferritin family protein [Candidatus Saccharibacteria bacterium]
MNNQLSQTQQNLLKAFAGESMARNKYTQFAKIARKDEQEWIARVFEETADNERAHAAELFEQIKGSVSASPVLEISAFKNTPDNLKAAAEGEKYEWTKMYPDFEKIAIEEKELEPARLFGALKKVQEKHEERYIIIARKLDNETLYSSDAALEWKCLNCGNIYVGKTPPKKCPVCLKPSNWYMALGLIR